jgi:uncharacterized protein
MNEDTWNDHLSAILNDLHSGEAMVDLGAVRFGVTAYLVRSLDGHALQFSIPVHVRRRFLTEIALDPAGVDGAMSVVIEGVKNRVDQVRELGPIRGRQTRYPLKYAANVEPFTVIDSYQQIASSLWRPDSWNYSDNEGVHLLIRGALPYTGPPDRSAVRQVAGSLSALLGAVGREVHRIPVRELERGWIASLDQKRLRERLPEMDLVCFVGDGTRPARECTQYRCYYRVAGPKQGIHVPFACPIELDPVEVTLEASGSVITGLGIRRREVFAVTGSNAEGKSTFLQAVIAGEDDHAVGDGREHLVTIRGVRLAEAGGYVLRGADVSLFFRTLPPGVQGTPQSVSGQGSGSMVMAAQVQEAVRMQAPLLMIDEDRAAANLLVRSVVQREDITPLSEILAEEREKMGDTALLFAAGALDLLTAQADRILLLSGHTAKAVDKREFRHKICEHLERTLQNLNTMPDCETKKRPPRC